MVCRYCPSSYYCVAGTLAKCGTATTAAYSFGGASVCSSCPHGWFCADGHAFPCPEGTQEVNGECVRCAVGSRCGGGFLYEVCPPGRYISAFTYGPTDVCLPCPPGTYTAASGSTSCVPCDVGTTATVGKSSCAPCPPGRYGVSGVMETGAASGLCASCPPGSFSASGGVCALCPAGTYSDTLGAAQCTACPYGSSSGSGAAALAACV